jgi:tetratricopeptide (TPR) repeat protein
MKSLTFAAGIAIVAIPLSAASGATMTLGGPLSQNCYQSAIARDARPSAIEGCDRSLSEEALTTPDRAATYVNRGILHMIRGHDADAEADFNAAMAIDGRLAEPWLNKGYLRLKHDNGRDALPLLEEGIKRQPQREALAFFARGLAYEDIGDLKAAYADLRRAHALEPSWALPKEYLARYEVGRR